jgi:hypothetical protein
MGTTNGEANDLVFNIGLTIAPKRAIERTAE